MITLPKVSAANAVEHTWTALSRVSRDYAMDAVRRSNNQSAPANRDRTLMTNERARRQTLAKVELSRDHLDRAKAALTEKLLGHSDADIRFLASLSELPDNNPAVQRIARALAEHDEENPQ